MKAIIPMLLISIPVFGGAYASNALCQNLGEIPALTGSGYEYLAEDEVTTLFHDGEAIMEKTEFENGYTITRPESRETVIAGENGERLSWTMERNGERETHHYFYDDSGRLSSLSVSVNGEIKRRIDYLETPQGTLAATEGDLESYVSPSFYVYTLDGESIRFDYHANGMVTRSSSLEAPKEYEISDDGLWIETDENGRKRTYDGDGRLIRDEEGSIIREYSYDGEVLQTMTVTEGENTFRTSYENGKAVGRDEYSAGTLIKSRRFGNGDEIEEIRYKDGKPEYLIVFDGDGRKVKRVERL